jgi:hypothetical protein
MASSGESNYIGSRRFVVMALEGGIYMRIDVRCHCTCHETLHVTCIVRRNAGEDAMVFFSLQSTEKLCLGNILYNQECHTIARFVRLDRTKRRKTNGTNRTQFPMRAGRIMGSMGAKS